jgi:hypothetical protein
MHLSINQNTKTISQATSKSPAKTAACCRLPSSVISACRVTATVASIIYINMQLGRRRVRGEHLHKYAVGPKKGEMRT